MNYLLHYKKLIRKAKKRELGDEYCEIHHIVPRSMGGSNKSHNLVKLLANEHYMAHMLLAKIFPDNIKIITAANIMCNRNTGNNKEYKWIREQYSLNLRRLNSEGVSEATRRVKKGSETMRNTGGYEKRAEAMRKTLSLKTEDEKKMVVEKRLKTINSKINPQTGKTLFSESLIGCKTQAGIKKISDTLKTLMNDKDENGRRTKLRLEKMHKLDENGLSLYDKNGLKAIIPCVIFDNNDKMVFINTDKNFKLFCHDNNLPYGSFYESFKTGNKLFQTTHSGTISRLIQSGMYQYKGWYVKKTSR